MTEHIDISPMDRHNKALLAHAHPDGWRNPTPTGRYNMVVIGGGTAGLVTAAGVAGLGGKVALIERQFLGGDCLNFGCVPSKALIAAARTAANTRRADHYGIEPGTGDADFAAVMERVRRIRSEISEHDSATRFRDLGVDVFIGDAAFTSPDTIEVDGQELRFAKACIATGARALRPDIEGLEAAGFHTNETIFSLTERPRRLAVLGSGPIGCELGQAFARLGSEVTIIEMGSQFLGREDRDAAEIVGKAFMADGIHCLLDARVLRVTRDEAGKHIHVETPDGERVVEADDILVGFGRVPNVDGLGLEVAGVEYDARHGIRVDDRLRTTNKRVYAAGDACLRHKFTHTADAAARIVIQNALFFGRAKLSALNVPWCTYTHPEVAHVGMYPAEAETRGIPTDTFKVEMSDIDRARTDGETEGFVKVLVKKGTDKILGATIVAAHAGDMISEISTAMAAKAGLKTLSGVIHPYPTQAEAIKRAADAYSRTRLTPTVKKLFTKWLAWQRR
ncbi:MAG: mercuric reductase [Lentisphaeria bacterium]|nr:mercuric reductase [Lentisphaeria bacterium]